MSSIAKRRWGVAVGTIALVGYAVAFAFFLDIGALDLSWGDVGLLLIATVLQLAALWLFGELFRQGVLAAGNQLKRGTAFRAALVGSSIARLLPAGGAVTPVAMAWAVRKEAPGSSGAAVRATGLNYAGLVLITAGGLFIHSIFGTHPESARTLRIFSGIAVVVAIVIIVVVSRLGAVKDKLPRRIRERLGNSMIDLPLDLWANLYLWGRLAAEAVVLLLVLVAFDIDLGLVEAVTAFGVSQIAAGIPGTPGGIGFAEAGLVGALGFFGVGATMAVAPVLIFRVVSYWLPAGAGLVAGTSAFLSAPEAEAA